MVFERFGFLIAGVITLGALAFLFIKSDVLLNKPQTVSSGSSEIASSMLLSERVYLSLFTSPALATVYIDGDSVGVSPLQQYMLSEGIHRVSIRKEDYVELDTIVTLADESSTLSLTLAAFEQDSFLDQQREGIPAPVVLEETSPVSAPSDEPSVRANLPEEEIDQEEGRPESVADPVTEETSDLPRVADPNVDENTDPAEEEVPPTREPVEPEVGSLQVMSEPPGASVWLGDQMIGTTPLPFGNVPVGPQQITLRLEGYEPYVTTVTVASDQPSVVNGELIQLLGTLRILARPWGNIYIDGKLHKSETNIWYRVQLAPGNHRIRVIHPTLGKWEQVIEVTTVEESEIVVDFNQGNSSSQ
ncbi:MAG: PEGA domain-containing protein [Rhodothermales bacterium]